MGRRSKIAGVVLAGGRSSRMGRDKALLAFNGRRLVDHMAGILRGAGLEDVYVSGQAGENCLAESPCRCLHDSTPFAGPAAAIGDVMERLADYKGVMFVPVDMPLLTGELLSKLMALEGGAHFNGWPLPVYIPAAKAKSGTAARAVHELLDLWQIPPLVPSDEDLCQFINANTPEEWKAVAR